MVMLIRVTTFVTKCSTHLGDVLCTRVTNILQPKLRWNQISHNAGNHKLSMLCRRCFRWQVFVSVTRCDCFSCRVSVQNCINVQWPAATNCEQERGKNDAKKCRRRRPRVWGQPCKGLGTKHPSWGLNWCHQLRELLLYHYTDRIACTLAHEWRILFMF